MCRGHVPKTKDALINAVQSVAAYTNREGLVLEEVVVEKKWIVEAFGDSMVKIETAHGKVIVRGK